MLHHIDSTLSKLKGVKIHHLNSSNSCTYEIVNMHSKIVKSTILVVYINFIKIAKFNYLKEVNIHY